MDRHHFDDDDEALPTGLPPQDVWADCLAGLDDLKHGRTMSIDVVLGDIEAKLAAWQADKPTMGVDGDDDPQRPAAD